MGRLDIRLPIGAMFTLLGVVLAGYGIFTHGSPAYERSLGINVDLWWGLIVLLFGLTMLALCWHGHRTVRPTDVVK